MSKKLIMEVLALAVFSTTNVFAQAKVYDIITLKDGKGIIKGFIKEQILGQSVSIIPTEATMQINYNDVAETPSKKTDRIDSTIIDVDVVVLKNGQIIEGKIVELAPNKWITITTKKMTEQSYSLENIERIGKGIIEPNGDIFKEYGVLDVINLKNGTVLKGIIIEQIFGETFKIKTIDKGVLVYDVADITTAKREAYDHSKDIFKQSIFLDVLNLKNGSLIKGIIIQQTPGEEINIETIGNSRFTQKYSDVVKLSKEINPNKEEDKPQIIVREPEFIGDCFIRMSPDSTLVLEKQEYTRARKKSSLILINGEDSSKVRVKTDETIKFIVRVTNNNLSPLHQIYVFRLGIDKGTKLRSIDTTQYPFLNSESNVLKSQVVDYEYKKIGSSSFEISFSLKEAGEYAVFVSGNDKTFSLFGANFKDNLK